MSKKRNKRILIFAPSVGRGGVHRVVETLTHALATHAPDDWEFAVLGQTYDEIGQPVHWPQQWPFAQIDPGHLPAHPHQFPFLMRHTETFYEHLMLTLATGQVDLVYCPSPWWVFPVRQFKLPVPFVTTVQDFAFDFIDMGHLAGHFRNVAPIIAKEAALTIFHADFHKRHGEQRYGFKRTLTIPNGFDTLPKDFTPTQEEAERVRAKYKLPKTYVLAFHCAYHKDPITILRGQHYARSHSPYIPPLVMAGIGTEHFLPTGYADDHVNQVRKVIKEVKARPGHDLFVLGRVAEEDMGGLYAGATCAVIASRSEGDLPAGIFEAFAAKTPVIYSDIPVHLERLGMDEKYGVHFVTGNGQSLGKALMEVCEKPRHSKERADLAFQLMETRVVADVVSDYIHVFAHLMNPVGKVTK